MFSLADLWLISPLVAVFLTGMTVLIVDVVQEQPCRKTSLGLSLAGLGTAMGLNCATLTDAGSMAFADMVIVDAYGIFVNDVLLIAAIGSLLLSHDHSERLGVRIPESRPVLLFSVFGMMLMAMSAELMLLFIAIEVMSIALYVLCALNRGSAKSVEGAFKYFILGAFASAILLYGIAFIYGATGSTQYAVLGSALAQGEPASLLLLGVGLLLVGMAFKAAAVPFHMWSPDVYEGAPTPVTAFMATAVKAATIAALGRLLFGCLLAAKGEWVTLVVWLSGLSIIVGNIAALVQTDLKRMLAYSSISHAGYLLMAMVAVPMQGSVATNPQISGVLFYLMAYALMTLGAFAVVSLLARDGDEDTRIDRLAGLAERHPWIALGMTVSLLALAGIPPTMGFVGKFYLFTAAVDGGFIGLAIVGAIGGAIGVYYYLRPIVMMYMRPAEEPVPMAVNLPASIVLGVSTIAMLALGIVPGPLLAWCREALLSLL
jgi:NADH-quinone oxidoreductase subunit N